MKNLFFVFLVLVTVCAFADLTATEAIKATILEKKSDNDIEPNPAYRLQKLEERVRFLELTVIGTLENPSIPASFMPIVTESELKTDTIDP